MKRRDFIKQGFFTSFVVASVPILTNSCKKDDDDTIDENGNGNGVADNQIDLNTSAFNSLNTAGNYVYFQNYIVINTGSGFIALSRICTHQGCNVTYNHNNQNLPCPCHGSVFRTNGTVVTGPASTALTVYLVSQEGDILTIN